ncbi:MAG: class I SAM-dependent methyltransferase, partial [Chloroflexi bacterium]|nr:class I SAM-dependent methyltransferase [Chloroflexota bacterium]
LSIDTLVADLETEPLPLGPFQVITCFRYRQLELFPSIHMRLNPGGLFVGEVVTIQNLERHDHPSLRFLAEPDELRELCSSMKILYYGEGWFDDQALARIVAQKELIH